MHGAPPRKYEHYAFEDLGDHIRFGRARPGGTALSNTGVVDLGGATLVFDTSLTLHAARETRAEAIASTGRGPSLCVNSHWHLDHMAGNQVFEDGPIYATKRTAEVLLEKRAELEHELTRETLEADIRDLERQRAAVAGDAGRAPYDAVLRIHRTLLEETVELRFTPPSKEFERELRLPGDQDARLLTYGAGHTDSDAVLFLPKSGMLFAGDLVVTENHPNLTSGDPEHWLVVLDQLAALHPERIATGHGALGSVESLAVMKDYLTTILELARSPEEPEIPARFRGFAEPDQFTGNVRYARQRRARHP